MRLRAMCFAILFSFVSARAGASEQLEPETQALGWWLGGSGVVSALAGGFALAIPRPIEGDSARDLQLGGGISLIGLGAVLLTIGVVVLSTADPGPCETSGTAIK